MENKYQESLDYLNKPLHWKTNANEIGKCITTLQELIDHQSNYISYQELKIFYENKIEKLEKALDKICKLVSDIYSRPLDVYDYQLEKGCEDVCPERTNDCSLCWKEWALKESEKQ